MLLLFAAEIRGAADVRYIECVLLTGRACGGRGHELWRGVLVHDHTAGVYLLRGNLFNIILYAECAWISARLPLDDRAL